MPVHPSLPPAISPGRDVYDQTLLGTVEGRIRGNKTLTTAVGIGLVIALAAALIIPSIQSVRTIREIDASAFRESGTRHRTALGRWLPTAGELAEGAAGENPYGYGHWFPTPPIVLLTLVPLWKIGYVPAAVIWATLKVAGFVLAMAFLLRTMAREGVRVPIGVVVMAAAFSIRPIISDLKHGNLNIFMMVWLALAWAFYLRRRDSWAGLFLALAVVTKVTPALALIYFLYKRQWRVCAWAGGGLILLFFVIPGMMLGFERNWLYLHTWFEMLVRPFAVEGYAALEIANQSLYGVLLRLLSNAGVIAIDYMPGQQALAAGMEEMARPATALGRLIRPAISLGVLAVLAWFCRFRLSDFTGRSDQSKNVRADIGNYLEFGLILLAMLLLSERTWKHHATTLPLVFVGLWYSVACLPWTNRFRGLMVGLLGAEFVLLVLLGEGLFGDELAEKMLDGGFFCWGLLLCFVQTAIILSKLPRSNGYPGRHAIAGD